ncbi:hypothetical protein Aca07nite_31630 [Actinoplanes capillaceus]|uniref:Transcriptional regulator n=1 Tax=Actinoplanes campanulatus TaxID=113559 RepID=A0ABQ3WI19_9ACTN|nr:hypothetical protein [Actinoplanes capillaceus]GID45888.1 hypothetical protein Aca07nite_31630 [Actinoplanes capillaceus]
MTATPTGKRANELLAGLLDEVGWRPETLARRANAHPRRRNRVVHDKTPYKWIARGDVPHGDLSFVVVEILGRALGRELGYEEVWGRAPRRSACAVAADDGLDLPWNGTGLLSILGEPVPNRRTVLTLAGTALTKYGWMALTNPGFDPVSVGADGPVTPQLIEVVDTVVAQAQGLDDQQGGAARGFVADQFGAVARLLRHASYDAATGQRLAAALAQLAQTAGFMAFDARDDGTAQGWYLRGVRAGHASGDSALVASILALMSNQAADRSQASEAVNLAAAAQQAAVSCSPVVRSLVAARSSLAYAASGDLSNFRRMRDLTLQLAEEPPDRPGPRWASYADRTELDAITGRGLVVLADHLPVQRKQLLREATTLLHARANTPPGDRAQRSALRHGAWLSLAHLAEGDLDRATAAGRTACRRVPTVTSARSVALLYDLRDRLRPVADRAHSAQDLLQTLQQLPAV